MKRREVHFFIKKIEDFSRKEIDPKNLPQWIEEWSSLIFETEEASAWAYIDYTLNTADPETNQYFEQWIQAEEVLSPLFFELKKKFLACEPAKILDSSYQRFIRLIENEVSLFRLENVELSIQEAQLSKQYQQIMAGMTIVFQNQEYTLQQASVFLENLDRKTRQEVWEKIYTEIEKKSQDLHNLYTEQIALRDKMAKNANFSNYRDYIHQSKNRFDYTPEDCLIFHQSIEKHILPLHKKILEKRKNNLKLEKLQPFDLRVDEKNRFPLKPFQTEQELKQKVYGILQNLDKEIADLFENLDKKKYLDLFSRKNKAPGGYNYALPQSGDSFIFMNACQTQKDVITLLHEMGHAYHAFLNREKKIFLHRNPGMEVAELASMSMELLSFDEWDSLYSSSEETNRAKLEHLKDIVSFFPWMACVDGFQHWVYLHPTHSVDERENYWLNLFSRFSGGVDWSGYENWKKITWMRQPHIFEVPFYYVEYGIAQIGALKIWYNSLKNKEKTIRDYKKALSLGNEKGMKEIYESAGIDWDFSSQTLSQLADFLMGKIEEYEKKSN